MRTARLLATHVSVATTRCQYEGVGPQVKKFEQVSSDEHQMSVPWEVGSGGVGAQV